MLIKKSEVEPGTYDRLPGFEEASACRVQLLFSIALNVHVQIINVIAPIISNIYQVLVLSASRWRLW